MDDEKHIGQVDGASTGSPAPATVETIADAGSSEAFLASFTPEDDKAIIRKVDKRFLLLIGVLYMTKTVSLPGQQLYADRPCEGIGLTTVRLTIPTRRV